MTVTGTVWNETSGQTQNTRRAALRNVRYLLELRCRWREASKSMPFVFHTLPYSARSPCCPHISSGRLTQILWKSLRSLLSTDCPPDNSCRRQGGTSRSGLMLLFENLSTYLARYIAHCALPKCTVQYLSFQPCLDLLHYATVWERHTEAPCQQLPPLSPPKDNCILHRLRTKKQDFSSYQIKREIYHRQATKDKKTGRRH